jgi:hypothetical protein
MPALPATIGILERERATATVKYGPLVERLGHGELLGLLDAAGAELGRRRAIWERELKPDAATRIGNG